MGKFVVKQTKNGFVFNLKAGNGEIIATSQTYSGEDACMNGIESVRKNAELAKLEDQTVENFETVTNPKFEVYLDKRGEYRFRLKARNGEIIATGEGYKAKASCLNGIDSIRRNAPESPVGFLRYAENPFELRLFVFINSAISLDGSPLERHPLHREL